MFPTDEPLAPLIGYRPLAAGDLDCVARVWLNGWLSTGIPLAEQPTFLTLRARIEREIATGRWHVTVAVVDGELVGFVAISPAAGVVEQLFVAPEHHRQGIGLALLTLARADMPNGSSLWTHAENLGAAAFYAKAGMTLVGPGIHPKQGHPILTFAFEPVDA